MTFRTPKFSVLLVSVFGLAGWVETVPGQTVVLTAKSGTELADDLESLIKAAAPEGDPRARAVLEAVSRFKAAELFKGLDRSRGFGLVVTLPKDPGADGPPSVVAAVPVSDFGQFLDSLKDLGLTIDDQPGVPGFSHKVTMPNGNPTLFLLQSRGYALCSLVPDGADRIKAMDPSSWKPRGRGEPILSITVQPSEIPEALKDQFLNQVEANVHQQDQRRPGEADSEYRGRLAGQNLVVKAFRSMVRDAGAITLDLDLNRKTSEIALEFAMTARPNTSMARTLRALTGRRSRFRGLSHDPIQTAWISLPVAKEVGDLVSDSFERELKEYSEKLESQAEKTLLTRFGELLKANLKVPEIDLGVAVQRTAPDGSNTTPLVVLGGMKIQSGREAERLVRDAIEKFKLSENVKTKPGEDVKIHFDVAKAADGTAIHQISGHFEVTDTDLVKSFGKPTGFFAFREDALLVSFGENGLTPLRRALDGLSSSPAPGGDESVSTIMHMARLGDFADKDQEKFRRAAAQVFRGDHAQHDRIHLGLRGDGDGMRLRLAIDAPVLKLLVLLGDQNQ
jgi:hypothetical protein